MAMQMLIDGRAETGARSAPVLNPANGALVDHFPIAGANEVDRAVVAARAALNAWSARPIGERRKVIEAIADVIETHRDELAALLVAEQGKPIHLARVEVDRTAAALRQVARFEVIDPPPIEQGGRRIETLRRPLGVVAAIVPWNFPLLLMAAKLPYALLAGNTVVLKPAPTTPLATLRLFELAAGIIPPGVVNTLGDDGSVGPLLSAHPGIDKISFTGSTETGRRVMASAAPTLKRLTLELGGNDAAIVLDDVDVDAVAPRLFEAAFRNSGQLCAAIKRLYVHERVYAPLCERLAALCGSARVGNGMDEDTEFGPLQNQAQFERVSRLIEQSAREGRVLAGGALDRSGYFIRPTLIEGLADDSPLVAEEQFGPVLPILRFDDTDDAVRRANASEYGLGGSVWSSDAIRAREIAAALECGTVWINTHAEMRHDVPFSGAKQSGLGVEMGLEGLAEFTRIQVINAVA